MTIQAPPRCWLVDRAPDGRSTAGCAPLPLAADAEPAADEAIVRVEAAGFNYKDALACSGHPGVARMLPLVPGIDAAGTLERPAGDMPAGTPVVVTGNQIGESRHGAFATRLRVPADAIVRRPVGLSARDAMALGTAGLTVLLACDRIDRILAMGHGMPGDAEWLVTGASGGVGMLAVAELAARGRRVVACTRKARAHGLLRALGAAAIATPADVADVTAANKPLVRSRWAGVVDTVGGPLLADALKAVRPGGVVAAIGMAAGIELPTTVHPFILRGVTLCGIDAASLPTQAERAALWPRLADLWPRVRDAFPVATIGLGQVGDWSAAMLRGETSGRAVVLPWTDRMPKHAINLTAAWEPPGKDAPRGVWLRRFGGPTGLEIGDAVWLVVEVPGPADVMLNGRPLPPLRAGRARWSHDVTALLGDRNELVVMPALEGHGAEWPAGRDAHGRASFPESLGRVSLEIVSGGIIP
jgi:acrylyl-CoA reductase (NADPH)